MLMFYDLETTGLDTKHQILSACFVTTDNWFNVKKIKNFNVALNPLEIPAESAIAVNAVDITKHMIGHDNRFEDLLSEEDFAAELHEMFIATLDKGTYSLVGYNSNKFDIKHLRKVLIKYGYNPYYNYNKFGMIDILNHAKMLRIKTPTLFTDIPNLKLSSVYKHLLGKEAKGQHEAESDVLNCVELCRELKSKIEWDIVEKNAHVNNAFRLKLVRGDIIALANPYAEWLTNPNGIIKYQVHDTSNSYILLKCTEQEKLESDYEFKLISKNDFCLAKLVETGIELKEFITLENHFSSNLDSGVENFIYDVKFKDIALLASTRRKHQTNMFIQGQIATNSAVEQMIASQMFSRARPILHTNDGVQYENFLEENIHYRKFFIYYYEKYLAIEINKEYPDVDQNLPVVKLIKEYKNAYKELYDILR